MKNTIKVPTDASLGKYVNVARPLYNELKRLKAWNRFKIEVKLARTDYLPSESDFTIVRVSQGFYMWNSLYGEFYWDGIHSVTWDLIDERDFN